MKHLKDRMQNYNDDVELCCDNIKIEEIFLLTFIIFRLNRCIYYYQLNV